MLIGRATTIFVGGSHYLRKYTEYAHAPKATRWVVSQTVAKLKQKSRELNDSLCQIIQSTVTTMPENAYPYMSSRNALRQVIERVRRENMLPQPRSLGELNLLNSLKITFGGEIFLLKDSVVEEYRQHFGSWMAPSRQCQQFLGNFIQFMVLLAVKIPEYYHWQKCNCLVNLKYCTHVSFKI